MTSQSQSSSPMEMSYSKLVQRAPPTPANLIKTKPPATIDIRQGTSNATSPQLPSSVLFSDPVVDSSSHADTNQDKQAAATITIEDRLQNLALKLQPKSSTDLSNLQPNASNRNAPEMHHQFIEILQNMKNVVSMTADEQQRGKKARALNTLLTMFETIIDERSNLNEESSTKHLEWKLQCLEMENQRLQCRYKEGETTMQHRSQEVVLLQQDVQRMKTENDILRNELEQAKEQCQQEYVRAQEAEQVASESEKVRDGLLSSYGRLTEENVDLLRAMEDVESEKIVLSRAMVSIREEVDVLRKQSSQLNKQLRESNKRKKELESLLDVANSAIFSANEDRKRLQDELHQSHKNSTAMSEQLMKLREDLTKKLQAERKVKAHSDLETKLVEEQKRRRQLADLVSTAKGKEDCAEELMRKLARSNAELRSQVNQMVARISLNAPIEEECTKEAKELLDDTNLSDNLSCYF